jgi:protein-L-isoaspartate(D-aspartate) O-methyltransferase
MNDNFDLDIYGSHNRFMWDHEHLFAILTTGKNPLVKNMYLKNAFKYIRRDDFVPEAYGDIAFEDKELPIGYDEVIDKPTTIAQMLQYLSPKLGGKYLDIGTGSGWVATLLAYAAGLQGQVYTIERNQFLIDYAKLNFSKYPNIKNIQVVFRDGGIGLLEKAPYDGIHVSASYEQIPQSLMNQLTVGGILVAPTVDDDIRVIERSKQDEFIETIHKGFFFKPIEQGVV